MFAKLLLRSLRARRSRVLLALLAVTLGTGVATALARSRCRWATTSRARCARPGQTS